MYNLVGSPVAVCCVQNDWRVLSGVEFFLFFLFFLFSFFFFPVEGKRNMASLQQWVLLR